MTYDGHCNCGAITVKLAEKPAGSVACHCKNCRRAGGPFSINYVVSESDAAIEDPSGKLQTYEDSQTLSGNTIIRTFCGTCGSPITTLQYGSLKGSVIVKASLFDDVSKPEMEVYTKAKVNWWAAAEGAKQL